MATARQQRWQDGDRWVEGDIRYTCNSSSQLSNDPGSYYLSMDNLKTGAHATAVYNSDGTLAEIKQNAQWVRVPTQTQKKEREIDWIRIIRDSWQRAIRIWFK